MKVLIEDIISFRNKEMQAYPSLSTIAHISLREKPRFPLSIPNRNRDRI
jgi:hypothetical protein